VLKRETEIKRVVRVKSSVQERETEKQKQTRTVGTANFNYEKGHII